MSVAEFDPIIDTSVVNMQEDIETNSIAIESSVKVDLNHNEITSNDDGISESIESDAVRASLESAEEHVVDENGVSVSNLIGENLVEKSGNEETHFNTLPNDLSIDLNVETNEIEISNIISVEKECDMSNSLLQSEIRIEEFYEPTNLEIGNTDIDLNVIDPSTEKDLGLFEVPSYASIVRNKPNNNLATHDNDDAVCL